MRLIPSYPIYSVTSYNTFISITPITHLCLLRCLNYVLQSNNNPHNSFPSSVAPLASPPTRTSGSSSATCRYSLTQHSLQFPYKNMVTQLPQSPLKSSPPSAPPPPALLSTTIPPKARKFHKKKADSMQPTTNLPISPDTLPWQIETYETSPRCKAKREEGADR